MRQKLRFINTISEYRSYIIHESGRLIEHQSIFRLYTAISIKVVPEKSGKVEYERERLAGNR